MVPTGVLKYFFSIYNAITETVGLIEKSKHLPLVRSPATLVSSQYTAHLQCARICLILLRSALLVSKLLLLDNIRVESVAVLRNGILVVIINRDPDGRRARGLIGRVVELGHVRVLQCLLNGREARKE